MKFKSIVTTVFFVGALFTGSALAADRGAQDGPPTRGGAAEGMSDLPQREAQPGHPRTQERLSGAFQEDLIPGMHRAENLIGQSIISQQGNDLGTIDDLVITEGGQIDYIILSRGGVAGMGSDLVPVPWAAANLQTGQDDQLRTDITEQQVDGAPRIERNNWDQIASADYEQQVHSYYGTEPRTDR